MPQKNPDPLYDHEAEQAVIGSVLIDPDCLDDLLAILSANDFYVQRHKWVWEAFVNLSVANKAIDYLTVSGELTRAGKIKEIGGDAYLTQIINAVPTSMHADSYAKTVADYAYLRRVIQEMTAVAKDVYNHKIPDVSARLVYLAEIPPGGAVTGHTAQDLSSDLSQVINEQSPVFYTGLPNLDEDMGGVYPTELTIVASRPGVGKTALCMQVGMDIAEHGKSVMFVSLEMERRQLWARIVCPMAGYEWVHVRAGKVDAAGLRKIEDKSAEVARRLGDNFIVVDDAFTVADIYRSAAFYRPDMIIIDQLSEIQWHDPKEKDVIWLGKAAKYLRYYLGKKLGAAVWLIHQINRAVEERTDHKPMLSDLRMSGELEQRADIVLLLHRKDLYDGRAPGQMEVPLEVTVAKNRQGGQGGNPLLNYNLRTQRFSAPRPL